jgi:GT2 family glycosyltransferase
VSARLSIVIPSHSRADLLRLCLVSVGRNAPPGTEVIVVDDGSRGRVVSCAAGEFEHVTCVRLPRPQGFCVAANAGIRAASAPIVELLNDDTEVTAGWAESALGCFDHPRVGSVAPLVLRGTANGKFPRIDSAGDRYYIGGVAIKRGHGEPLRESYLRAAPVFGASGSSAFYRRDLLLRLGGFPETFGAYFEDVDLAFRIHRAGYDVVFQPAARVWHRVSASYGRPRRRLLEQQSLNEERVFWRNLPVPSALPQHLAVLAAKAWKRWCDGGLAPFLCGRLRLLGELGELRRHRRWLKTLGPESDPGAWMVDRQFWA